MTVDLSRFRDNHGIIHFDGDELPLYGVDAFYADDDLARSVIKAKYLAPEDNNNLLLMWTRIASATAEGEVVDVIRAVKTTQELAQHRDHVRKTYIYYNDLALIDFRTDSIEDYARSVGDFWSKVFFELLKDFNFIPGGRINYSMGRKGRPISAFNCYFNPFPVVEGEGADSLEAIYQCLRETGITYASQGGVGNNLAPLRPAGAPLRDGTESPGAVRFMDLVSVNTNTIAQNGRRGANMQLLPVWHPDIEAFIAVKNDSFGQHVNELAKYNYEEAQALNRSFSDRRKVSYSNISVVLTGPFMDAVLSDGQWDLIFPHYEKVGRETYNKEWTGNIEKWQQKGLPVRVYKTIKARELWYQIIQSAHQSAEPGLIFEDQIKKNWTITAPFSGVNPCAEIVLSDYEPCDLGHINLDRMVTEGGEFDFDKFLYYVRAGIRFLDNIHTTNTHLHALDRQRQASENFRRLGLGITGLGDMFIRMGMAYDSEDSLVISRKVARFMLEKALEASIDMAEEKGAFPKFDKDAFLQSEQMRRIMRRNDRLAKRFERYGIRNAAVTTIAPVGTGSILTQTSSGIEPLFSLRYERLVKRKDGEGYNSFVTHPKIINDLFGGDENLPDYARRTAHKIDPHFRVQLQSVWQKEGIMNSISSTVNLDEDVSVEVVSRLYIDAYKHGLKGLTVYREGSRYGILRTYADQKQITLEQMRHLSERLRSVINGMSDIPEEEMVRTLASLDLEYGFTNGEKQHWDTAPNPQRPQILSGYTTKVFAEGSNWYLTFNSSNGHLMEVFATTNTVDPEVELQSVFENVVATLHKKGVDKESIKRQLERSEHQNLISRTCRMISLGLRNKDKVKILDLVEALYTPDVMVTQFAYHLRKELAKHLSPRTKSSINCAECGKTGTMIFENGCVKCSHCGYSQC